MFWHKKDLNVLIGNKANKKYPSCTLSDGPSAIVRPLKDSNIVVSELDFYAQSPALGYVSNKQTNEAIGQHFNLPGHNIADLQMRCPVFSRFGDNQLPKIFRRCNS